MALFTALENSQHCKKQRPAISRIPLQCLQRHSLASQNIVSKFYKMLIYKKNNLFLRDVLTAWCKINENGSTKTVTK